MKRGRKRERWVSREERKRGGAERGERKIWREQERTRKGEERVREKTETEKKR